MTVKELIQRLSELPEDGYVDIVPVDYGDYARIEVWSVEDGVRVKRGFPVDFDKVLDVIGNED